MDEPYKNKINGFFLKRCTAKNNEAKKWEMFFIPSEDINLLHSNNYIVENVKNYDLYEIALTILIKLCGFKNASAGSITYNFGEGVNPHKSIGVQFQDIPFPRNLSVRNEIDFVVSLDGTPIGEKELEEMLLIFSLTSILDSKAHKLSGGH